MGGEILNRLEAAGHRSAERKARLAAIERGARVPVLAATALLALVAWWLSGWALWPWAGGVGTLVLLALVGVRRRLGVAYTVAAALVVVDVWFLLLVEPWWWGLLAGFLLTGAGALAAVKLRFRTRRQQTAGALAVGLVLLVVSAVMLVVDAADRADQAQHELNQAHEQAVARILPHTPGSLVSFLVERIGMVPTHPESIADTCFVFSPAAQRQLAAAHGGPDCVGAVRTLAARVRDRFDYINNLWLPGSASQSGPTPNVVQVDACHLDFSSVVDPTPTPNPGPQLGLLTLQRQHGEGLLITGYRPCPPA